MSEKTRHTPGPWSIYKSHITHYQVRAEQTGNIVAATAKYGEHAGAPLVPEVVEANARLIAAAPELLEALEYVVKYHRDHDSGEGELYGLDYITTCIAAITKAKGATK